MTRAQALARIVAYGREHLAARSGQQRAAELEHFGRRVIARPKEFLEELDARLEERRQGLPRAQQRQLALLAGTPDLFSPLDHIRAETLHTRVIAWALSPRRLSDGLGVKPLRALLEVLAKRDPAVLPEWADAAEGTSASPERHLGAEGRVDVWIELQEAVLAIEVKVDHSEREDQTKDYRCAVEKACERPKRAAHLVFLTLDGSSDPSDERAICVSFRDLLLAWLPVAVSGDSDEHRYLSLYLRTVARHLVLVSDAGPFASWAASRRAATLTMLMDAPQ